MIVEFDAFDLINIAMYAERFHCVKVANQVPDVKKITTRYSSFAPHYLGAMGEFALRKGLGCSLDMTVTKLGSDIPDTIIKGWTAQIKTITYVGRDAEIPINSMEHFNAEILVGVKILNPLTCCILGYIHKGKFMEVHKVKDYSYGNRLMVGAEDLLPIDTLPEKYKGIVPPTPARTTLNDPFDWLV